MAPLNRFNAVISLRTLTVAAITTSCLSACADDEKAPPPRKAPPRSPSQNLLPNSGFERGTEGWQGYATEGRVTGFRRSRSEALSGTGSLRVSGAHNARETVGVVEALADPIDVRGRRNYVFRSRVRVDEASAKRGMRQRVAWYDAKGKLLGEVEVGAEQRVGRRGTFALRDRFAAPRGAVRARIRIGTPAARGERVSFTVDDVRFRQRRTRAAG